MKAVDAIELVGRILFGLIFIAAVPRHFSAVTIAHAADFGTPLAALLVPLSGVMTCLGGLSVVLGYRTQVGACLLVAFLVPVTLFMHPFWSIDDAREHQVALSMFAKNLSMLGAAMILFVAGSGRWSLDEWRMREGGQEKSEPRPVAF